MIIGKEELKGVIKVLHLPEYKSVLSDTWPDIAMKLGIPDDQRKNWKKKHRNDDMTLKEILIEMVDTWTNAKGSNAHLNELLTAFRNNGLTSLAEALTGHLRRAVDGLNDQPNNYWKYPPALTEFFTSEGKNYTIISTLDTTITCKKVKENSESSIFTTTEFLLEVSKKCSATTATIPDPPIFYVVTVTTLDEVKKVLNATKKDVQKLLIISKDSEENLKGIIPKTVKIVKDEMQWDDLTPIFKEEIATRLKEINSSSETACGQVLVDLINGVDIKLFESTIPEELLVSYYIPREIIPRNRLDKDKLLKNDSKNDIFVCSEIDKVTLSGGVETGITEDSSDLLSGVLDDDIRFVALNNNNLSHFPFICNKTNKSVHLIEFQDGEFHWLKTSGDIKTIQEMIKVKLREEYKEYNSLEHFQETDFVNNVIAKDDTRVVCLSDTPGMGKSVLLASIGRQLKAKRDSKTPVIFLPINDLIEIMEVIDQESLRTALHQLSCKNQLEEEVISEKLTSSKLEFELLLDGFDEVERERLDFALRFLQFLQKECTSIRIWISTRPHHLEKLEQTLSTIGFNIRPFIKADQINFLKSYWLNTNKDLLLGKLNELDNFAQKVLEKLSTGTSRSGKGSTKEVEIAGIPLQCLMLAEIYEEDAVSFCGLTECKYPDLKDIDSIATLYRQLVERKIQKYEQTYSSHAKLDRASLYSMHYKLALELLFPSLIDIIIDFFKETLNIEELLNVGLLERKKASSDTNNFIHRTFAEYFCAHFVAEKMIKKDLLGCDERFISFFYNEFLSTSLDDGKDYSKFSFCNFVPCYFLNSLISSSSMSLSTTNITLPLRSISPQEIRIFLIVCSNHNLRTLFKLFTNHPNFEENECDIIDEEFFIYSIKQHDFQMFKIVLRHFKNHSKFTLRLSSSALYAAVECLDPKKLQHLLKVEKLFGKLVAPDFELKRWFKNYYRLIDELGKNSVGTAIAIDMINLLVETEKRVNKTMENKYNWLSFPHKSMLDSDKNDNWRFVYMDPSTAFQMRLELIKLGANIFQKDKNGNNILHLYPNSDEEYMQYFDKIEVKYSTEELTELLKMKNYNGWTPLAFAFKKKIQLSIKCLEKFKGAGVDFTEVFNGDPLFLLVIQSGNGEEVIRFMIKNGLHVDLNNTKYLECAVEAGNIIAVRMLVDKYKMDVNTTSISSQSQLDNLFLNWNRSRSSEKYFLTAQELWNLGGKLHQTTPEDLKKLAFRHKDLNILRFALDKRCLNVNEKDSDGNTLLHLVAKSWPKAIKLVLDFGAKTSEKNKLELTPLDVALKSGGYIEDVQGLKPSSDWSMVSSSVTLYDFKYLTNSAKNISDWNDYLSLFKEVLGRSGSQVTNTGLHSLLGSFDFTPPQFNSFMEYLCTKSVLIEKLKTRDENGATPLHYAVRHIKGIEEKTLKTIKKTINLKLKDKEGRSLLFYAVEGRQSPEFLELLHKYGGGDFKDKDNDGHNLLHVIVANKIRDFDMVKFLLKKAEDPTSVDRNGNTLLHLLFNDTMQELKRGYFGADCQYELVELLLTAGAKPETKNKCGDTVLGCAWYIMKFISRLDPSTKFGKVFRLVWKFKDANQGLPFASSSFFKDEIAEFLFGYWQYLTDEEFVYFTNDILKLKDSMTPNWPENFFPFRQWKSHLTSSNFHLLVENLIENGRVQTFFLLAGNGMRALHHVVSATNVEESTLKLLQDNGIDLGVKDENGRSLLFHAINRDWTRLKDFKLLEKYGGGAMTDKDNSGKKLLHVAVSGFGKGENNSIVLEYLLHKVGLDPNEVDNEQNTPLHILLAKSTFVDYEDITKTRVFIEAGAKVNLKNSKGDTPAELVRQNTRDSEELKEHLLAILSPPVDS